LKSKTGERDFINLTFTNLPNLPLTVGVLIHVEREVSLKDLRPSFNNSLIIETSISVRLNGIVCIEYFVTRYIKFYDCKVYPLYIHLIII